MTKASFLACAALALTLGTSQVQAAELVTNGGFETGDFTGFTRTGNQGFTGVSGAFSGTNPYEGNFQGYFGAVGSAGTISQTLATVAGQQYLISFALRSFGGRTNSFAADFGATNLITLSNFGNLPYNVFTFTETATSAATVLSFRIRQDPSYYLLDSVSVVGVPEPATWALMITGFGVVGGAMRRRSKVAFA